MIKKLVLSLVLVLVFNLPAFGEDWQKICKGWGDYAEIVMRLRQQGASMEKLMTLCNEVEGQGGKSLARQIIIMAYEESRYSTEQFQQRKIEDFRDVIYLFCVKTFTEATK
jgi:hypothetical protein